MTKAIRYTDGDWAGIASRLRALPDAASLLARAERFPTTGQRVRYLIREARLTKDRELLVILSDAIEAVR